MLRVVWDGVIKAACEQIPLKTSFKWKNIHSATVFVLAYVRVLFFDFLFFLFQSVRNLLIRRETRNDQTVLFYQTNFLGVIIIVRRCYIQQNTTQNVLKMVGLSILDGVCFHLYKGSFLNFGFSQYAFCYIVKKIF